MSGDGDLRQVTAAIAPLRRNPVSDAALDTEALIGERVLVWEEIEGWARVTLQGDGYGGFMSVAALGAPSAPTHRVAALRTFVYPGPSIRLPPLDALPLAGLVRGGARGDGFIRIARDYGDGFVHAAHLAPVDDPLPGDFVAVAERFLETPYLWGGKSALGIDCSGLVQVALAACGIDAPRDSGPQREQLGGALPAEAEARRGDLVFWPGHVGILRDAHTLLHASGHHMTVVSEPLAQATERIRAQTGHAIAAIRRINT
ncbi:MAG: C40 family peptidase [Pseudochelatococcus sp.]|jgi:cell wall-associated NlpC family hydrolase|uniref:C40 family peptidase n=1 Tax=Pseudochelatococcus sp. TaxID=2020869 RepID=UPI003D90D88E